MFSLGAYTQGLSNIRVKTLSLQKDTLRLDSLSLVPHTLQLKTVDGRIIDSTTYDLFPFASILVWKQKPNSDSLRIQYRVFPFALANKRFNKDYNVYRKANQNAVLSPFFYSPDEVSANNLIDFGTLDYNGNFSRGLSFGSNQDVVLNSAFNLQLQGMLTRDLEVTAAITDNNIPIQPEGNTQQIQEFDKIFIQLKKDQHRITVGDFDMNNPETYFLRYTKKAQGGNYDGGFDFKKYGVLHANVGAGIAKGKFSRNILQVSEGNQGPYKLTGSNGETYIVILANSEEIFINGQKMQRGADRDYVIDYNLGTVTFTPRRIITKDLRVTVEFEFSERNYQRTMANATIDWLSKKVDVHFNLYTEQDSKNQNIQQTLNDQKKLFLASLGDSLDKALYPGYDSVAFDINRILYEKKDTNLTTCLKDTGIFIYGTDPSKAKYSLSFAYVGDGKGHYLPSSNTANGRVYAYSAPVVDSCTFKYLTGSYEPVIKLVTPKLQQMYTLGTEYRISKGQKITAEGALSNTDLNTFSKKNDNDNLGGAARIGYKGEMITHLDSTGQKTQKLNLEANYEFVQNRFRSIERYRTVEFSRDFNLGSHTTTYNEHLGFVSATYSWSNLGSVSYRFRTFIQDTVYKGYENIVAGQFNKSGLSLTFNSSFLNSKSSANQSFFIRPKMDISYTVSKLKGWRIGAGLNHEINKLKNTGSDTLNAAFSHLWQNYNFYISSPDSLPNQYKVEYTFRSEQKPNRTAFDPPSFIAHTVNFTGTVSTLKNQILNWTLTYRRVDERDSAKAANQLKNYYLGRIDYSFNVLKGFLKSSTLYEIGAGREQKIQLTYLRSPNNTGDYIYKADFNNTSGVKQLSEFIPKGNQIGTPDSSFVRFFQLTPEFLAVNSVQLNEVLNINPAALLRTPKGFMQKAVALFSLSSSIQLTKKIYASGLNKTGSYFNPFPTEKKDTNIVSLSLSNRNTLFFNRMNPKFGAQVEVVYSQNKTLLTSGFENRLLRTQGFTVRWNIYKGLSMQSTYTNGLKANESEFFKTQQYRFNYNETNSELSYQYRSAFRLATTYYYGFKSNVIPEFGGQFAVIHQFGLDAKYTRLNKTTVSAKVSYATIGYSDKAYTNQQAEYAMLEGLKNGNNFIWNIAFEQKLSGSIQLLLGYDGRKTGLNTAVHTGRAELRAIF